MPFRGYPLASPNLAESGRLKSLCTMSSRSMNPPVLHRIELPNDRGNIVLYDWMAAEVRDGRNLVGLDRNGRELWRAEPVFYGDPKQEDCFTRVVWDGAALTAFTFSCFRVAVDIDTGKVTVLELKK